MEKDDGTELFHKIDRSFFIDEYKELAAYDGPLPIGYGQTISQPTLVWKMTQELALDKNCSVLEVGTGSGYQTAFLAECARAVYTVELVPQLSKRAKDKLDYLGYKNIFYKIGDGSDGWEEYAPFDRIITTAAAERIPDKLIRQLKAGGMAIAPVGPQGYQDLLKITKDANGKIVSESLGKVTFVELKGEYGWGKHRI
ncbi:MAG: protein-L-isoaspartate(D-aspartate) O-methyltransferase [Christensenellales bacterium]